MSAIPTDPGERTTSLRVLRKIVKAGAAPSPHAIPLYVAALSYAISRLENPEPKAEVRRAYARGYRAGLRKREEQG